MWAVSSMKTAVNAAWHSRELRVPWLCALPVAAWHRNISVKATCSSFLVILPAGQKYANSNSDSAVDEIKSRAFKKLCHPQVLPQFQSDVRHQGA